MINIKNRFVDEIKTVNVMNDKEVVKLEFKCENQVTKLLKLSDCTVYINYQNGTMKDRYLVNDLTVDGNDVNFSWTLGANATKRNGKTFFVVCAQKTNNGTILREWNSVLTSFDVEKGLEAITQPTTEMQDLFTQLTEMIEANTEAITEKQDKLTAGENITIVDSVISATGGSGGTSDYDDLTNKPRVKYYPSAQLVNINNIENGIYDAGDSFTLVLTENDSISVEKGAVFTINVENANYRGFVLGSDNSAIAYYKEVGKDTKIIDISFAFDYIVNYGIFADSLEQTTGQNENAVMSQKAVSDAVAGKQDALVNQTNIKSVNNNSLLGSGDLSLSDLGITSAINTKKQLIEIVDELPSSNINSNALYLIKDNKLFPDASDLVTSTYGNIAITYDSTNGYRAFCFVAQNNYYAGGNPNSATYKIYTAVDGEWVLTTDETTGTGWLSAAGWSNYNYANMVYANFGLNKYSWGESVATYDTSNNLTDIHGTPYDTSTPCYLYTTYAYNNEWVNLGTSDFTPMLQGYDTALANRYTKTEVDTLISAAIADVSALIGGNS